MDKLLKKLGGYSLGPILGAFISFITIPLITYFISPDEFGRASMFTLATSLAELVVYLGLDQSYVKYYFEYDRMKVFWNAAIPSFFFSVFCGIAIVLLHRPISILLFDNDNETLLVLMLAIYLPFSVIGRFHSMFARMAEHAIRYSVFTVLSKLLMLVACVICFYITGKQFRTVVYATVLAQVIAPVLMLLINIKEIHIKGVRLSKDVVSKLLRYGIPLMPAALVGWVLNSIDKVMIRRVCGYEQLGLYTAALKIVSILAIIQSCFVAFWSPIAFKWNKEGASVEKFDRVGRILSFVMAFMFAGLLLFKDVLVAILSPEYRGAVMIIPFLLLHPVMYTISEVTVIGIYFTGKSATTIIVAVISCVINVAGNVLLIPCYGAIGASIATGFSYCVFFWLRTIISRKVWKKNKIGIYIIYTIFFVSMCVFNLLIQGVVVYILNLVACVAVLFCNIPLLKDLKEKYRESQGKAL